MLSFLFVSFIRSQTTWLHWDRFISWPDVGWAKSGKYIFSLSLGTLGTMIYPDRDVYNMGPWLFLKASVDAFFSARRTLCWTSAKTFSLIVDVFTVSQGEDRRGWWQVVRLCSLTLGVIYPPLNSGEPFQVLEAFWWLLSDNLWTPLTSVSNGTI